MPLSLLVRLVEEARLHGDLGGDVDDVVVTELVVGLLACK